MNLVLGLASAWRASAGAQSRPKSAGSGLRLKLPCFSTRRPRKVRCSARALSALSFAPAWPLYRHVVVEEVTAETRVPRLYAEKGSGILRDRDPARERWRTVFIERQTPCGTERNVLIAPKISSKQITFTAMSALIQKRSLSHAKIAASRIRVSESRDPPA